jgi:hypothetical protein
MRFTFILRAYHPWLSHYSVLAQRHPVRIFDELRAQLGSGIDERCAVSQSPIMNNGVMIRVALCGLLGLAATGCGSDSKDAPNCGTAQSPMAIALKDVSPAPGASLPNSAIVERFTIVGQHLQIQADFGLPAAHTAGQTVPTPVRWTYAVSGADTVYTSEPFAWQNAPAHVEVDSLGLLQTPDGCVSALPNQIFNYDVTTP